MKKKELKSQINSQIFQNVHLKRVQVYEVLPLISIKLREMWFHIFGGGGSVV